MNANHPSSGMTQPAAQQARQTPVHRARQVLHSLTEDRADLATMIAVLDAEKAALDNGEHSRLEETAQQKVQLAAKLEQRHKQREKLLPKPGESTAGEAGIWQQRLAQLENQSGIKLAQAWQEVDALLRESDKKLRVNEKIVASLQGNVNRFINLLREQSGAGKTYNAAGEEKTFSNGHTLGSA